MTDIPPASEPAAEPAPGANSASTPAAAPPTYAQPTYAAAPGYAPYGQPYAAPPKTNTLAIVSLVLSLVGVGIGGIITGHIALNQIKLSGESGRGLALAGTIIGYVAVGLGIILIIFYVVVIALFAGSGGFSTGSQF
jgi:hypothetical protein